MKNALMKDALMKDTLMKDTLMKDFWCLYYEQRSSYQF